MTWNKNPANESGGDDWGGDWTEKKLQAFSRYVWSYLKIMKANPFWKTIYFDGFAGSGTKEKDVKTELYYQLHITEEEEKTYQGAAERVLTLQDNLAFDYYYFIDKKEESLKKLRSKLQSLDLSGKTITYKPGDANKWLIELSNAFKRKKLAALVFLDPFGMQIDWSSIASLKGTRSDVWILIPTGVIVNRLLDKAGNLKYIDKLKTFFGMEEEEIKSIFYKQKTVATLFGEEVRTDKISKPIEMIAKIYANRMKTIWKFVTKPLALNNSNGIPIFHFVFASNNQTAYKIAGDIIKTV